MEKTFDSLLSFSLISAILSPEWEGIPFYSADDIKVFYHRPGRKSTVSPAFFRFFPLFREKDSHSTGLGAVAVNFLPGPLPRFHSLAGVLKDEFGTGQFAHRTGVQGEMVVF